MRFDKGSYPALPGVYLVKDASGTVIYIGKAASIRERLAQHFSARNPKPGTANPKTAALASSAAAVEFIVTKDAGEALVLESNLIKSYMPRYNMLLKDAKHFSYLALTREGFPRLLVARKNSSGNFRLKNARFFGPFVEGSKRAISARYLRKLFRIRICGVKMPKKECLQYHLGNCDAPCTGRISGADYGRNVDALAAVLEGKARAKELMAALRGRMKAASDSQDYELAASLRDQMRSLEVFFERQRVEGRGRSEEDFVWFQRIGSTLHVQMLRSRNGVIAKSESHMAAVKEQEEPELSFCLQYYAELPDRVYSNLPPASAARLNAALGTKAFMVPGREKARVLDIAAKSLVHGKVAPEVIRLKGALSLESLPIVIETFDISTLFGEESVGSMVRFVNGIPDKAGYRRFRIRAVSGQDDFAMVEEVVRRRYARLAGEGGPFPDLVLIDGGAGQLHFAIRGMDAAGVRLPVAALAKKEEEIYLPSRMGTLRLPRTDAGLKLLQRCRDEAHRFAISYQRLRRGKKMRE